MLFRRYARWHQLEQPLDLAVLDALQAVEPDEMMPAEARIGRAQGLSFLPLALPRSPRIDGRRRPTARDGELPRWSPDF